MVLELGLGGRAGFNCEGRRGCQVGEEKGQRCGEVVMGPLSRAGVWSLLEAEPAGTKPR